ncbi:hypothetical protein J437_LFUL017385 [Ladona fulva]|uniref:Uncharacterized protein n=1 Tax=Ladona fulva TaxID=123851 RepID=A0A8K0KTZ8_LADFU|nr:hypothetical protein J437_LFUL017385 [Ladona fulva]
MLEVLSTGLKRTTGRGPRFVILSARSDQGFVENARLVYPAKKNTGDYHDEMDSSKKEEFKIWLTSKGIEYPEKSLKIELIKIVDSVRSKYTTYELDETAKEKNIINPLTAMAPPVARKRDLESENAELRKTLEGMEKQLSSFRGELKQAVEESPRNKAVLSIEQRFTAFEEKFTEELRHLAGVSESLDERMDALEQYSRRNCLLIHGIPETPKEKSLITSAGLFRDKLKVSMEMIFAEMMTCRAAAEAELVLMDTNFGNTPNFRHLLIK